MLVTLQVDAAFEYLRRWAVPDAAVGRYNISIAGQDAKGKQRGIYLREPHESGQPAVFTATVDPLVHEDAENDARLGVRNTGHKMKRKRISVVPSPVVSCSLWLGRLLTDCTCQLWQHLKASAKILKHSRNLDERYV